MLKKSLLLTAIAVGSLALPMQADAIGVDELQSLKPAVATRDAALSSSSWGYKTLKTLYKKYGVLMDIPESKFNGTEALSRNEAALILVNLMGKIEKDKLEVGEFDKERIEALSEQLQKEVGMLTARVSKLETNVASLKGNVARLEDTNKKGWSSRYGEKMKLSGTVRGSYNHDSMRGTDMSKFRLELADIYLSGKLHKDYDYFVMLNPNYTSLGMNESSLVDRAFIKNRSLVPYHTLTLGKQPLNITKEGSKFYAAFETGLTQLPSILQNSIKNEMGAKLSAKHKYVNYSAGIYNQDSYNKTSNGLAFNGLLELKPLADFYELGELGIGGTYYTGNRAAAAINSSTDAYSLFGEYKKGDFRLIGEWSEQRNGEDYLSKYYGLPTSMRYGDQKGWYVKSTYYVTPKAQLLAQLSDYNSGLSDVDGLKTYTTGVNYYIDNNLKLVGTYTFYDDEDRSDRNQFYLGTQFMW